MSAKINKLDQKLFAHGMHYELYKKLGAHFVENEQGIGVHFSVWAPNAQSVSVIGDFNEWKDDAHVMEREEPAGIYTIYIPNAKAGDFYKYAITTKDGRLLVKADPFAYEAEARPGESSKIVDTSHLKWSDEKWLKARKEWNYKEAPMTIYEAHIGSWRRHKNEESPYYNYREFAHEAAKYINEMGYTHIELMGICEYPYDGSWGYQVTGYFAPTSRYGSAEDFAYMVNYFHEQGIGVILDWVPAHFAKDSYGLVEFDGTPLYEYADPEKGNHKSWGTKVFDYGKAEVRNFLISSALYWVEQFHVDALRVDAVASILYLDFGRDSGEWTPNINDENVNLEAVEFLKELNATVLGRNPGVLMIAEESSTWEKVTGHLQKGGLGFSMKWNMGWMHDFLEYIKLNPCYRKGYHHNMTFASSYMYDEDYVLTISHDEVVHEKKSILNKMEGPEWERHANLKPSYAFMMGHPGKKLLFMGQEFAQSREWSENRELDWDVLEDPKSREVHEFFKKLLQLYKTHPAMYEMDYERDGFEWINADDCDRNVYSFIRYAKDKKKSLIFLCNFAGIEWKNYDVSVPQNGNYKLILSSESEENKIYQVGYEKTFTYNLPSYGVAIFEF